MTLAIFDQVNIVARAVNISPVQENWKRSDGKGLTFTMVPYYIGPLQYLALARAVSKAVVAGLTIRMPYHACWLCLAVCLFSTGNDIFEFLTPECLVKPVDTVALARLSIVYRSRN